VRFIFSWDSVIVFDWEYAVSSAASTAASAATTLLSEFQTTSPLSSPKTFDMKLSRTFELTRVLT
jgi:hypothetical protein